MSSIALQQAFTALKNDLLAEHGPRISTMRNYRFAIVPYPPEREFEVRRRVHELTGHLRREGWEVLDISMHRLLMQRLRTRLRDDELNSLIASEKRQAEKDPLRPLSRLQGPLARLLDGDQGVADDVVRAIGEFADAHPDRSDNTLIWLSRLGSLYPFVRTSSLLKHLDGKTRQMPVVLLYPGEQRGPTALSFMGELEADRDYRPRIYASLHEASRGDS